MTMLPFGTSTFLPSISMLISGHSAMAVIGAGTQTRCTMLAVLDVVLELVPEVLDEARTGIAAASPSAQMVRPSMLSRHAVQQVQVLGRPWPCSMR
jgi:hypothetical protein